MAKAKVDRAKVGAALAKLREVVELCQWDIEEIDVLEFYMEDADPDAFGELEKLVDRLQTACGLGSFTLRSTLELMRYAEAMESGKKPPKIDKIMRRPIAK